MTSIGNGRGKGGMKQIVAGSENRKALSTYRHKITARSGMKRRRTSRRGNVPSGLLSGSGNKRYAVRPAMRVVVWSVHPTKSRQPACAAYRQRAVLIRLLYEEGEAGKGKMAEARLSDKAAEWRSASGEPAIKGCGAAKREYKWQFRGIRKVNRLYKCSCDGHLKTGQRRYFLCISAVT